MDLDTTKKHCSFCGEDGRLDTPLVGGRGAFICATCVEDFAAFLAADRRDGVGDRPPPWETMSDLAVLDQLWQIAETGHQADEFLAEWVDLARSRRISWTEIGKALGISRVDAQQRFGAASRA